MTDHVILAAGDDFVRPGLFTDALRAEPGVDREIRELLLPWPGVPWSSAGGVREASGDEETLVAALSDVDIAVTHLAGFTERVFAAASSLRLVVVSRGGPVNVDLTAAARHGVAVCYAPGRNAVATAEYAIGLILATVRGIARSHASLAGGTWSGDYFRYDAAGMEIEGTTVGVVGHGAIGSRVARILTAFGAEVLVHDPHADPSTVDSVPLGELLGRSRIVTLHARATAETEGMIGAKELASMPRGSVLVNCARGSLVDQDALCDALDAGHLSGAGLDVYPEEPVLPGSRLLRTPGLVTTPHIAGCSREVAEKAARICAAEVGRHLRGEALANPAV
ncbi:2-hydroxyacid dehydrogenase [Phytomonospora endophytica]|uniref:D-3-phosphoglycerate dehydrogenase n=1 Tax=Phytomonospora endophytica TaxID=714109 RepID=A0A841FTN6_9ACTN|nr:2-hydroxyacid dehydrogenase [Phytomonospora endophytica]MBB6038153.1 D-3-phosphoglycerate dehydrogenase [Phytomonospora endophytica]GIG67384.1 oxidoreductase [Phytomonospora endophytica]